VEGLAYLSTSLETLRLLAQKVANRNLTQAEWQQYFPDGPEHRLTFEALPKPLELTEEATPILLPAASVEAERKKN
jgi:hypothetical protein